MRNTVRRLSWFGTIATTIALGSYFILGSIVYARAAGLYEPIILRDVRDMGTHTISGMIAVSSTCDQISVSTESISDEAFAISFKTWRELSDCKAEDTPRHFRHVITSPAHIRLIATLDGIAIPIVVNTVEAEL